MRSKKITIYISLTLLIIACALFIASFFGCVPLVSSIFNGLGLGVLGSAVVTFAISVGEYSNEKRIALENYYSEAYSINAAFSKILYCDCDEEKDLLVAFTHECKTNEIWKNLCSVGINQKSEAKDALINYYKNNKMISNESTEQQINGIIYTRKTIAFDSIEKSIESYMQAASISLKNLENAYGRIDYFTKCGNRKNRNWICNNLHVKIRDSFNSILRACYYFEEYKKGDLKNNFYAAYDQLKKVTGVFFSESKFDRKEDRYVFYKVTATVISDIEKELAELRYRIYKDKLEAVEPEVVMIRQINMGVNENV